MVLFRIKVNFEMLIFDVDSLLSIYVGETNRDFNRDFYNCSFTKMIEYWRQTWNNRTNGITDIQFPFGFVQVSFDWNHKRFHRYVHEYWLLSDLPIVSNIYY